MITNKRRQNFNDSMVSYLGIKLKQEQYRNLKKRVDLLKEKCPAQCSFNLKFQKRNSCFIGELIIKSFSENFYAKKIAHDPYQAYLMLEQDIEQQLMEWKKRRFNVYQVNSLDKLTSSLKKQ